MRVHSKNPNKVQQSCKLALAVIAKVVLVVLFQILTK
jgi:hypothetical protein